MAMAKWNGVEIAQSDDIVIVEGNYYFPLSSLHMQYFRPSTRSSHCPWKGDAGYYDIIMDDNVNAAAAWYYADPKEKAKQIKGRVAFWNGVIVTP